MGQCSSKGGAAVQVKASSAQTIRSSDEKSQRLPAETIARNEPTSTRVITLRDDNNQTDSQTVDLSNAISVLPQVSAQEEESKDIFNAEKEVAIRIAAEMLMQCMSQAKQLAIAELEKQYIEEFTKLDFTPAHENPNQRGLKPSSSDFLNLEPVKQRTLTKLSITGHVEALFFNSTGKTIASLPLETLSIGSVGVKFRGPVPAGMFNLRSLQCVTITNQMEFGLHALRALFLSATDSLVAINILSCEALRLESIFNLHLAAETFVCMPKNIERVNFLYSLELSDLVIKLLMNPIQHFGKLEAFSASRTIVETRRLPLVLCGSAAHSTSENADYPPLTLKQWDLFKTEYPNATMRCDAIAYDMSNSANPFKADALYPSLDTNVLGQSPPPSAFFCLNMKPCHRD